METILQHANRDAGTDLVSDPASKPTPPVQVKKRTPVWIAASILIPLLSLWLSLPLQNLLLSPLAFWPLPTQSLTPDQLQSLDREVAGLQKKLDRLVPADPYFVVSTTENAFKLMKGQTVIREGLCSTGSLVHLRHENDQEWLFETPRGAFKILKKTSNPVWNKPDWAFIEQGLPVPPPGSSERLERGVLGDYSLSLGSGYLIHGTLYQRMLGMPVTHGCVRLGDDDLEAVYHALYVGSRVFIY